VMKEGLFRKTLLCLFFFFLIIFVPRRTPSTLCEGAFDLHKEIPHSSHFSNQMIELTFVCNPALWFTWDLHIFLSDTERGRERSVHVKAMQTFTRSILEREREREREREKNKANEVQRAKG
jgi:hypothetical protein